jgi:hypothetical protein
MTGKPGEPNGARSMRSPISRRNASRFSSRAACCSRFGFGDEVCIRPLTSVPISCVRPSRPNSTAARRLPSIVIDGCGRRAASRLQTDEAARPPGHRTAARQLYWRVGRHFRAGGRHEPVLATLTEYGYHVARFCDTRLSSRRKRWRTLSVYLKWKRGRLWTRLSCI